MLIQWCVITARNSQHDSFRQLPTADSPRIRALERVTMCGPSV